MELRIALAGNPNSGKSTLFNGLTGSNQYVGNWPGVTVEKKDGTYKKDKSLKLIDLPGIYSLSPYTLEEVVSRDYLLKESPDAIINVVDASNIERNLYLTTQLAELGIPVIIALNMMDVVRKNGDEINIKALKEGLGCEIVEISALKGENIDHLMDVAKKVAEDHKKTGVITHVHEFNDEVESYIRQIEDKVQALKDNKNHRWYAIKLFESDPKIEDKINVTSEEKEFIEKLQEDAENKLDDDGEGIITDARYEFVTNITHQNVKKAKEGMTTSDKIDRIVTNRVLALPIFAGIMFLVYFITIKVLGSPMSDWVNDVFVAEILQGNVGAWMDSAGVAPWIASLVTDGVIGGVGAVLGFLPLIIVLYILLAILEDVGYMSRIAFILDRIFRKFGLSGKSFIPVLIGTGCSVPGIMATRTIENDQDRRMTIIVSSFMPCGAKTEIIALFAGSVFTGIWWFGPLCYFAGIAAVIVSGVIIKKTSMFAGDPAPFVMELPQYHFPSYRNVIRSTYDRSKAFVIKAGTIILLAALAVWLLQNISVDFEFHTFDQDSKDSILSAIGKFFAPIFIPLGFGNWIATVASALGLVAKEVVVGTMGVLSGIGEVGADDANAIALASRLFTPASAMAFMIFNQLNVPCFAALGAIRSEMNSTRWTWFTVIYQTVFAYTIGLMVYQFSNLAAGGAFTVWTGVAFVVLIGYIYLLFIKKPNSTKKKAKEEAALQE